MKKVRTLSILALVLVASLLTASDTTLNRFVASGTTAERMAFTPSPPTPASGPDPGYTFWDTDLQALYCWDVGMADWVACITGGAGSVTNTGTLAANALVIGNGGVDVSTTTTGTGIVTALGVNVGSAGAPVLFNGAGGTPSSLTLTSATGLPLATGVTGVLAGAKGGGLVLVEKKLVTSDSTDITFSSLDGDTDDVYLLMGRIIPKSSVPNFSWQPNAVTTNQQSARVYFTGNVTTVSTTEYAYLHLFQGVASTGVGMFSVTIYAKKDPNSVATVRWYTGTWSSLYSSHVNTGTVAGQWNETATNITSIVIHSDVASGIASGSEIALYKYAQS